jgi:hypothetical protein
MDQFLQRLIGFPLLAQDHEIIENCSETAEGVARESEGYDEPPHVAVPMEKLKWVNEPVRTSSTAPADKSTVGEANRANRSADDKWYPDHAVFNATKDQLKAMPQFKYN